MSYNSEKENQEKSDNQPTAESPVDEKSDVQAKEHISPDRLAKEIKNKAMAQILSEFFDGQQQIVLNYVDNRSGGIFFNDSVSIKGDVIGRDQSKQIKDSAVNYSIDEKAVHIPSGELKKLSTVYVAPSLYNQAKKILEDKHLLIIHGQSHWGKWSSAIHLLFILYNQKIFEINPDIKIDELLKFQPDNGIGYIIDTLIPESAEKLKANVIKELSNKLKKIGSHLIITIDSNVYLIKDEINDYVLVWNEIPNRTEILKKHLNYYLVTDDQICDGFDLIKTETVQQVLQNFLLPGEIDRLAELLSRVVRKELSLEEALARFEAHAQQQVEMWFKTHSSIEQRTFMLSLAVLNGASYDDVLYADQQLHALIKPISAEKELKIIDSIFENTSSSRVKEARAQIKKGYVDTEFGRSPVDLIAFDNPSFQPIVLRYAWQEYDRLRELLLNWLYDLGLSIKFSIRARAAAAVGAISKYNFIQVREKVLLPWANHDDDRVRTSAALLLGIPAWESEFAAQVLGLLHHWSTLRNNWKLCWTAAAAYGGLVGLRFPDSALRDLFNIACSGDLRLFGVVNYGIINLFRFGRMASDYYFKVIDTLFDWVINQKNKIIAVFGLFIFLQLSLEDKIETNVSKELIPTILWIAQQSEEYKDKVASLWQNALNYKATRIFALDALRQWLSIADNNEQTYQSIEQIIVCLAVQGTGREKERLYFYLNRWTNDSKNRSKSASKILTKL